MTRQPQALIGEYCTHCGAFKSVDAFYARSSGKLDSWCKTCRSEWAKARRKRDPVFREKARVYQREYWTELRADPVAYNHYLEKQRKRRK